MHRDGLANELMQETLKIKLQVRLKGMEICLSIVSRCLRKEVGLSDASSLSIISRGKPLLLLSRKVSPVFNLKMALCTAVLE